MNTSRPPCLPWNESRRERRARYSPRGRGGRRKSGGGPAIKIQGRDPFSTREPRVCARVHTSRFILDVFVLRDPVRRRAYGNGVTAACRLCASSFASFPSPFFFLFTFFFAVDEASRCGTVEHAGE